MSSAAQKPLAALEVFDGDLNLTPPALLVAWPSAWRVFFDNLADHFRRPAPPLQLTSAPGRFWPDVFVHRPLGKKNFLISAVYHGGMLSLLYLASVIHMPVNQAEAPPRHYTLTWYKVSEYLPEIHSTPPAVKMRVARKGEPALAKQEVISIPERPDNREQIVIDPTSVRVLPRPVALPNLAGALPVPPAPKVEALRTTPKITFDVPQVKVIAPAAAAPQEKISQLKLPDLPTPSVVEPPPTPEAIKRNLGALNMSAPAVAVEAPKLPVPEQQATGNSEPSGAAAQRAAAPPPPAIPAGLGGNGTDKLLALALHPATVEGPIQMPGGNRMGEFAASPAGKPDAPGTPDIKAASQSGAPTNKGTPGGAGHGAEKNAPGIGISVGPPPPGAQTGTNGGVVVQAAPQAEKPASSAPQQLASLTRPRITEPRPAPENANPEEAIFAGKRSYSLTLNMPNLASAGGSWVIHFAELAEHPAPGELSAPIAVEKVDPKYPASMMRDGVEGSVTLYAIIRSDGTVAEVKVLQSLNEVLDQNARAALEQWRFRPATKNGAPVDLEAVVTIPFKARSLPF